MDTCDMKKRFKKLNRSIMHNDGKARRVENGLIEIGEKLHKSDEPDRTSVAGYGSISPVYVMYSEKQTTRSLEESQLIKCEEFVYSKTDFYLILSLLGEDEYTVQGHSYFRAPLMNDESVYSSIYPYYFNINIKAGPSLKKPGIIKWGSYRDEESDMPFYYCNGFDDPNARGGDNTVFHGANTVIIDDEIAHFEMTITGKLKGKPIRRPGDPWGWGWSFKDWE